MTNKLHKDKGQAGLTVLLSLIVTLFVIGLLVMIFAIMSGKLANTDSLYARTGAIIVGNESISLKTAGTSVAHATDRGALCTLTAVYNGTTVLANGNVSKVSECVYKNNSLYTAWKLSYTYTKLGDNSGAVNVINKTSSSIASVSTWFDIFIVIGAMVVLILLTVIIIVAIRSSGMIEGSSKVGGRASATA